MQQRSYDTVTPIGVDHAVDFFLAELARNDHSPSTLRSYEYELGHFLRILPREYLTDQIQISDYRRFIDRWTRTNPKTGKRFSPSTIASKVSLVRGFSTFLYDNDWSPTDVALEGKLKRPRRMSAVDLPVVTVSTSDVGKMFDAVETMQELICLAVVASTSRRRTAVANARRSDADLDEGFIRFVDKGGKVIAQPIPDELLTVLRAADEDGVWTGPDDYLIPNRRPSTANPNGRSSKVIYETVTKVATRAGVRCHVHALRAAFATHFLTNHPDRILALKELMGHTRIETTLVYLRRMNRAEEMESVRDLSWGFAGSNRERREPHGSNKRRIRDSNPCPKTPTEERGLEPNRFSSDDPMRAKLVELRETSRDLRRKSSRRGARI